MEVETIAVRGVVVQVAICDRCNARVYPGGLLKQHLARHVKLDRECNGAAPWFGNKQARHKGNKQGRKPMKNSDREHPVGVNVGRW